MLIAVLSVAMSESRWVVAGVILIYLAFAVALGAWRGWKELDATFQRQQEYIAKAAENAKSHEGDLAEAERRLRVHFQNSLRRTEGDFAMNMVSNRGALERIRNDLAMSNVEVRQLRDENAKLREDNAALRMQIVMAAPFTEADEPKSD